MPAPSIPNTEKLDPNVASDSAEQENQPKTHYRPSADGSAEKKNPNGRFPCNNCGAMMTFSPKDVALKCPYCAFVVEIPKNRDEVVELDFEKTVRQAKHSPISGLELEVACDTCGAHVLFSSATVTSNCPYCGNHLSNNPQEVQEMIPPNAILPCGIDNRQARTSFEQWVKSRWFAPNDFKHFAHAGQLSGLYIPYFSFDSMTTSYYEGQRGDNIVVQETYQAQNQNGQWETRTRSVVHTIWTPVSGRVDHFFDDLLFLTTKSLPVKFVNALEPWDLQNLVNFEPVYLPGFRTERYQISLQDSFKETKARMDSYIRGLCLQDIGGDAQHLYSVSTQHLTITFKHLLLPVWHAVYRYKDKPYHIVVNARTGEVQGDRPISFWKVFFASIAGALTIAGIVAIAMQFSK